MKAVENGVFTAHIGIRAREDSLEMPAGLTLSPLQRVSDRLFAAITMHKLIYTPHSTHIHQQTSRDKARDGVSKHEAKRDTRIAPAPDFDLTAASQHVVSLHAT